MAELAGFINSSLMFAVHSQEEIEVLYGSGAGADLHGIFTQASAFNTSLVTGAWSKLEIIAAAITQIAIAKNEDARRLLQKRSGSPAPVSGSVRDAHGR